MPDMSPTLRRVLTSAARLQEVVRWHRWDDVVAAARALALRLGGVG